MTRNRLTRVLSLSALLGLAAAGSMLHPGMVEAAGANSAAASQHDDASSPSARFGAFARMANSEWTIDAAWDDGSPLKAREVVDWILDGQFMRSRVFVTKPDGTEYQRYETIYVADPEHHGVRYHGFAYNGAVTEGSAHQTDRNTIVYPPQGGPSGGGPVKQQIVFLDDDTMQWSVWAKEDDGSAPAGKGGADDAAARGAPVAGHEAGGGDAHGAHADHEATHTGRVHLNEADSAASDDGRWKRLIQANWRRVRK